MRSRTHHAAQRRVAVVSGHMDRNQISGMRHFHLMTNSVAGKPSPAKSKVQIDEQGLEATEEEHDLPDVNPNAHFGDAEKATYYIQFRP